MRAAFVTPTCKCTVEQSLDPKLFFLKDIKTRLSVAKAPVREYRSAVGLPAARV